MKFTMNGTWERECNFYTIENTTDVIGFIDTLTYYNEDGLGIHEVTKSGICSNTEIEKLTIADNIDICIKLKNGETVLAIYITPDNFKEIQKGEYICSNIRNVNMKDIVTKCWDNIYLLCNTSNNLYTLSGEIVPIAFNVEISDAIYDSYIADKVSEKWDVVCKENSRLTNFEVTLTGVRFNFMPTQEEANEMILMTPVDKENYVLKKYFNIELY